MSELPTKGYQTLRDFLNSSQGNPFPWDYIEILDDTNSRVLVTSISGDGRAEWKWKNNDDIDNLEVEIVLTGSDSDISTPITLSGSRLWNDDPANVQNPVTQIESFADALLNQSGDTLTVTHHIDIPQ